MNTDFTFLRAIVDEAVDERAALLARLEELTEAEVHVVASRFRAALQKEKAAQGAATPGAARR